MRIDGYLIESKTKKDGTRNDTICEIVGVENHMVFSCTKKPIVQLLETVIGSL